MYEKEKWTGGRERGGGKRGGRRFNSIFIQYQIVITNIINVDKKKFQWDK